MEYAKKMVIHTFVGVVLFMIIALIAWALWEFTEYLKIWGAPYHISLTCRLLSELLFAVDVICFLFVVGTEAFSLVRLTIRNARGQ